VSLRAERLSGGIDAHGEVESDHGQHGGGGFEVEGHEPALRATDLGR
jgi:hypothetical protein